MYSLYAIPGSCSLGIHVLLNTLDQPFEYRNIADVEDFKSINPVGAVPVLGDGDQFIREGGAIALYLLEKHDSPMLPQSRAEKNQFLQKLFFNYATLHPAYSKLFFAMANLSGEGQRQSYEASAKTISALWNIVDHQLEYSPYMYGNEPTILDYLLCVYANWGNNFDVDIELGENVKALIHRVVQLPQFQLALKTENLEYQLP